MSDFAHQRERMVRDLIAARGIKDERVLAALRKVPRHLFVKEHLRSQAYGDHALPIGAAQTISRHRPVWVDLPSQERQKRAVSSASACASSGVMRRGWPPIDSSTTPPISPSRSVRVQRTPSPTTSHV